MLKQVVRSFVMARVVALLMAVALVIGAVACGRLDDAGPPATTIPPTQPAAVPTSTPDSEGSVGLATPDDTSSLEGDATVAGTIAAEPRVTPPALLPGTAEPTAPALRSDSTSGSEGPTATETPTSAPPAEIPPTDTPTPVPPTNTPAPPTGNRVGQSAPDFEVTTTDGVTRSLTDYKQASQPLVLYFFSST